MGCSTKGLQLLISALFFTAVSGQAVQRSSFGHYCNETTKCDKGAWLTCQNSSCACLLKDMTFDTVRGKCVSKSGERCKFQVSDTASEGVGLALYENTECVENAHCANGFTCSCVPGYYETMDGLCVQQKDYNEPCTSSAECLEAKILFCIENKCSCASESEHIYEQSDSNSSAKCLGKAGKVLIGNTTCVEQAVLKNEVCTCSPTDDYYAGLDGMCYTKKGIGENCIYNAECKFAGKFFTCIKGQCGCNPATTMYQTFQKDRIVEFEEEVAVDAPHYRRPNYNDADLYYKRGTDDTVKGKWLRQGHDYYFGYINAVKNKTEVDTLSQCVGLARQLCNIESNCVKNAECNHESTCACKQNFSPTSTGTCGIGYMQICSKITPCSDAYTCTDSLCKCPQSRHQIFSEAHQKCVGIASAFCSTDTDCLENLVCRQYNDTGTGQCACADGFVENGVGMCDRAWNTTCEYIETIPCDTVAGLQCRNGFCSCSDSLTSYSAVARKCLGLVGSRCDGDDCVNGAKCVQTHAKISGRCLCEEEFTTNDDHLCEKNFKISEDPETSGDENQNEPNSNASLESSEIVKLT